MQQKSSLLPATVLAIGIALSGFFAGNALVKSRLGFRTITVKGLAEREVKADLGFWPIRFTATGATLEEARTKLIANENSVKTYLGAQKFAPTEYQVQNVQVQDKMVNDYNGEINANTRYVLTEDIMVRSNDVEKISNAAKGISELLSQGIIFSSDAYNGGPSFMFTKLNDLKPQLLTEATQRAKDAALKFATESGSKVGKIQDANQGIIEVNPAIEIPNESGDKQIDKKVRVVTTITYFIKD
ncbi:MAG: SIMPL domain-containing protein [Caulobacterales bacterium]|nr:SIMPL domain-containing protein [Caulobacterales bacterium]MCA0372694.1 SIMPL domain-containing protein [Pseudomonadota bacterium]